MYKLVVKKELNFPDGSFSTPEKILESIEEQNKVNMAISRYFNSPFIQVDSMDISITLNISSSKEDVDEAFALEDLNIVMDQK